MSLMVSISGVRGIVGETLTPETVIAYTSAFAEYCRRGPIVLGRDGRISGKIIGNIVSSTLLSMGCDVIAIGVAPTPTVALAVGKLSAAGGIAITASHNPIEWNGLKFISSTGMFLNANENKKFWSIAEKRQSYVPWNKSGRHAVDSSFLEKHIQMVVDLPYINVDVIRKKKFKVVVDCINSAGGVIVPKMLRLLGCDVVEINCDVSGIFARTPEPVPENLGAVCAKVNETKADLGIVVDPDVDRLVFITEKGEPFGEEYTVTSAIKFILEKLRQQGSGQQANVVVNLSTTRAVEDVAKSLEANVLRTPVGEINVATRMKELHAVVGGEGSGGVIVPAVHYGRDAIVGIGIILQQLAEFPGTLSEFKDSLPQYTIVKSKIAVGKNQSSDLLDDVKQKFANAGTINVDDGLKIDFENSWVHLRKSNTEPIIRIIAEAPTAQEAEKLVHQFQHEITQLQRS
jgi:phosphomannomutase